jgi:flagellin-specific chaperone FliS
MLQRPVDANVANDVAIMDEVIGLMLEIKGAWDAMPEHIRLGRPAAEANG